MSKAVLKEVREAIKSEKYSEAIEKCERLLKDEPKNHMAYLLLGAAYESSDKLEAAKYLRKAVECSPAAAAATVALNGLAKCAPVEELPNIYKQLLELVPDKYSEYFEKLFAISSNAAVTQSCLEVFKKYAGTKDSQQRNVALKYLARLWVSKDLPLNDDDELFKAALEVVVEDVDLDEHLLYCKRYLKLLYKQNLHEECLQKADLITAQHPSDVYAFEWICKLYCENYKNPATTCWWRGLRKGSIHSYAKELLCLNPNSGLALLIEAIEFFEQQQFNAARDHLRRVQTVHPNYMVALELLALTEMELGAYELALDLWQKLDRENKGSPEMIAECMSHSDDEELLTEALQLLSTLKQADSLVNAMARCYFKLGLLNKLKELPLSLLCNLEYLCEPSEAISQLEGSEDAETFEAMLLLGKLQLQQLNYSEALTNLLKATRLRPHRSQCFYYLGRIYYATQDKMRARKCYEKCLHLNPVCDEAVTYLSVVYQEQGEEDLNIALLLNNLKHTKNDKKLKIRHYKLGLHYMKFNKWDDAIQSFRTAIKFDVKCTVYWESLGDAYSERGSYNSAIRVFQKILELDPANQYARFQLANTKKIIRMYSEAIEDFKSLLQDYPNYVPALKSAAEAHLCLANNLKVEHRYGRCKSHLQLAVNLLQRAFSALEDHEMIWLWRLTANVFVQTAQMPNSMANLDVSGKLAKLESESVLLDRNELLQLAIRFYTCALKLNQNTFLWYELALCAYYRAQYFPSEQDDHLELALKACRLAIKEQSDRWQNWNLLGVINMHDGIKNFPLAQHFFIQALQLERKSYTAWTNLGVLYLKLGDIKLANQSFQRAQQSRPIYPNAWIGQAMIAETIGEDEEALDLFRHCQQFEYHPESALGYAHWVCTVLTDEVKRQRPHYKHAIENMCADVVALDAVNWYSGANEENASIPGLTFLGFLNARHKLYQPAIQAYRRAASKAESGLDRDKLNTDLGYLYLKLNQPLDAINAFNAVSQASFAPIIGLALAYYRAGQHQEAYNVYSSVLKSVTGVQDDKAALILVAMAAMVYASQGEADTKTILYQCILLKNSPIQALYSACALGILHDDNQLTETIINELGKYENSQEHCAHIAYLRAQYYLAKQQPRQGLSYLISRIHMFPACVELRKILANYLLDNFAHMRRYQVATSQIALGAIEMGHSNKQLKNSCMEDSESLLIASRALQKVDEKRSLKLIQRAVHLYPQNTIAWNALLKGH